MGNSNDRIGAVTGPRNQRIPSAASNRSAERVAQEPQEHGRFPEWSVSQQAGQGRFDDRPHGAVSTRLGRGSKGAATRFATIILARSSVSSWRL